MNHRIRTDPEVLGGQPFFDGTRIPLYAVREGLLEGHSPEELLAHFPRLTLEDIEAAVWKDTLAD